MAAAQGKLESVRSKNEWRENYFHVTGQRATCVLCNETISSLKVYNLRRHYKTKHLSVFLKSTGNLCSEKFDYTKYNLESQLHFSNSVSDKSLIRTSYEIVHEMTQHGVPFIHGDVIKRCIMKVANNLSPENIDLYGKISLSASSITRRTNDLAANIMRQIYEQTSNFLWYSLVLDEFTDCSSTSKLFVFIRGVNLDFQITAELLSICDMNRTTNGGDIFKEIQHILHVHNLQWNQLRCVTIDGGQHMARVKQELVQEININLRKFKLPDILFIHSILHQQACCGYNLNMSSVLNPVIVMINLFRRLAPNFKHFRDFLDDVDSEFGGLPYDYRKMSWLNCTRILTHFYDLRIEIEYVFAQHRSDTQLRDHTWNLKLAFLVDMIFHINEINLKLQHKDNLICDLYRIIKEFREQLSLMNIQLASRDYSQFECLCKEIQFKKYVNIQFQREIIRDLDKLLSERFSDLYKIENDIHLFQNPFNYNIDAAPTELRLELINLQASDLLQEQYKQGNLVEFYRRLHHEDFLKLKKFASVMVSMFGTTYLCQQTFYKIRRLKTHRTSLNNESLKAILLIGCSNFKANIDDVLKA